MRSSAVDMPLAPIDCLEAEVNGLLVLKVTKIGGKQEKDIMVEDEDKGIKRVERWRGEKKVLYVKPRGNLASKSISQLTVAAGDWQLDRSALFIKRIRCSRPSKMMKWLNSNRNMAGQRRLGGCIIQLFSTDKPSNNNTKCESEHFPQGEWMLTTLCLNLQCDLVPPTLLVSKCAPVPNK